MKSLIDDILQLRASLFSKQNEVKLWKHDELKYYDDKITQLKTNLFSLEKYKSSIISNIDLLKRRIPLAADSCKEIQRKRKRKYENKQKAMKRKSERLHKKANEVLKILTNGKVEKHCALKNRNRLPLKIHEIERKDGLVPRYHLEALKFLTSNSCFDRDAVPIVEKMANALAVKQTATLEASKRKLLKKTGSKKQCSIIDMMTRKKTTPATGM